MQENNNANIDFILEQKRAELERLQAEISALSGNKDPKVEVLSRPKISDPKLASSVERILNKLEAYYPEHKIFALDNIDGDLRGRIAALYKKMGYATVDDMLRAYGFEIISGDAVKELRSFVMYTPGNEPEAIRSKIQSMLSRLSEYYPDKVIPRGLQTDHKSLSLSVSGLYRWLGYPDARAMLEAYGYQYQFDSDTGGRPSSDYEAVIAALVEKYKTAPKPRSMGDLMFDNPELKGQIKTLQNKSAELFGMTLKKYFDTLGIFASHHFRGKPAPAKSIGDNRIAFERLAEIYRNVDNAVYGTYEDAIRHLENMTVKYRMSTDLIYVQKAIECSRQVTIPYGIDYISEGAFSGQSNLEQITIAASISKIPVDAFRNCASLREVILPRGLEIIAENAFEDCTSLESILLPDTVKQIHSKAFSGCSALENVIFTNPNVLVRYEAFDGCPFVYEPIRDENETAGSLFEYSIDRKNNITINGFTGNIEKVVIPKFINGRPVTSIGRGAFQENNYLVEIEIPDSVNSLQNEAFNGCISLKKVHLSNSIDRIYASTFNGCISLQEINIPDSVRDIKRGTFRDSPIKKLHIGKSLSSINADAFANGGQGPAKDRSSVNRITVDSNNANLKAVGTLILSADGLRLIAAFGACKNYVIPDGVETIEDEAFMGLRHLSDITLPESLVDIGIKAFAATSLRSVIFGKNLKHINTAAFERCDKMTTAIFNEGLEVIGSRAFEGCPITSVHLPASLRGLGKYSFNSFSEYYSNDGTQKIVIDPKNPYLSTDGEALYTTNGSEKILTSVYGQKYRQYIYGNRQKLPEYVVAEDTTSIGKAAFSKCTSLGKVSLPNGLLAIEDDAFLDCQSLKDINIPSSVEIIGSYAFKGTAIKEFVLGAALRKVGLGAFITGDEWSDKRTKIRSIKVDKANESFYVSEKTLFRRKSDGTSAAIVYFGGDEVAVLPDGVSEICSEAFTRSIIQEIQIPASVKTINDNAFYGCSKLTRLRIGFAKHENGMNYAIVYIPETKSNVTSSVRNQYMDCIRINKDGTLFDFVKYDGLFETIAETKDKILVATDRLKSSIQLVPLYRDKYLTYLRRHAQKAVQIVVEFDDLAGLNTLAELNVFTGKNIDQIIELANKAQKPEILSYLMNYKNTNFGVTEEDYDL